jgi:zinc and cadmium transporter
VSDAPRFVLATVAVIVLAAAGGLLPLIREWDRRTIRLLLAFGTGVLLGAAFLHMIPEAVEGLGRNVGVPVVLGFLTIYVLERFLMMHACEEEHCDFHHMGLAAFLGITTHSLIDGFALGGGLAVPRLGLPVTLAIILHKLPDALSLTGILLHCNYPKRRIVLLSVLFAFATPVGAVLSWIFLTRLQGTLVFYAIAFSAGTFLAIATGDLLPQVHSPPQGRYRNLLALFVGILLMSAAGMLPEHSHGGGTPAAARAPAAVGAPSD